MEMCARRWAMSKMLVDKVGTLEAGGVDGSEWVAIVTKKICKGYSKLS